MGREDGDAVIFRAGLLETIAEIKAVSALPVVIGGAEGELCCWLGGRQVPKLDASGLQKLHDDLLDGGHRNSKLVGSG